MHEQKTLPIWARRAEIMRLTGIPRDRLMNWALCGEVEWRKFGNTQQSAVVYRVADVLRMVENLENTNYEVQNG